MLRDVHQLVSNCLCLLFAAEQVVYSGLLLLLETMLMRAVRPQQLSCGLENQNKGQVIILFGLVTMSDTFHITFGHFIHC